MQEDTKIQSHESKWEVINKETKAVSVVTSQFFGEDFVDVTFREDGEEKVSRFSNENHTGNLTNELYAVRLVDGKFTVNCDGTVDDNGEESPLPVNRE